MSQNLVRDIMSTKLTTVSQYDNLLTVRKLLMENRIHHIPVLQDDKLVGIVSSADFERSKQGKSLFINHNLDEENETLLHVTLVGMIMTKEVKTITADATLQTAYQLFKNHTFRSLPVLENGQLVGIITPMDLLDFAFAQN